MSMKLFVWRNVLTDWTSGHAYAVAVSEATARKKVIARYTREHAATHSPERFIRDVAGPADEALPIKNAAGYCHGGG